jgi:hypothetical protein
VGVAANPRFREPPGSLWIRTARSFLQNLRMLMTQLISEFGDHRIHLILQMKLLLFQLDFFEVILFRHMVAAN